MIARYGDLLIGGVPIVNLEWIQKIHRDTRARGYSVEAGASIGWCALIAWPDDCKDIGGSPPGYRRTVAKRMVLV